VTPLSRRTFVDGKVKEDLNDYAAAVRRVAAEEHVACVDLNALSTKLLDTMTQEQADAFDAVGHADAKAENQTAPLDRTHLNDKGKAVFGRMVADALVAVRPELKADLAVK
jgi:lysophospholipase L1-like esterase